MMHWASHAEGVASRSSAPGGSNARTAEKRPSNSVAQGGERPNELTMAAVGVEQRDLSYGWRAMIRTFPPPNEKS